MKTHAHKTQEKQRQSVAATGSKKLSVGDSTFPFVDNRPEAIAQRTLRELVKNSSRVSRLKSLQALAENSPRTRQATQSQALLDSYSAQKQQPIHKTIQPKISGSAFNMVGESHDKVTRSAEKEYLSKAYGIPPEKYWTEFEFLSRARNYAGIRKHADPPIGHVRTMLLGIASAVEGMRVSIGFELFAKEPKVPDSVAKDMKLVSSYWKNAYGSFILFYAPKAPSEDVQTRKSFALEKDEEQRMQEAALLADPIHPLMLQLQSWIEGEDFFVFESRASAIFKLLKKVHPLILELDAKMGGIKVGSAAQSSRAVMDERNVSMIHGASQAGQIGERGVWKVGNEHIRDLKPLESGFLLRGSNVTLTEGGEFREEMAKA